MYRTCNGVWAYTDPSTRNQIYPRTSPYAFLWPHVPHKYEEDAVISAHRHGWCHVIDAAMTCLRSPPQVGTCSGNRLQERKCRTIRILINNREGGGYAMASGDFVATSGCGDAAQWFADVGAQDWPEEFDVVEELVPRLPPRPVRPQPRPLPRPRIDDGRESGRRRRRRGGGGGGAAELGLEGRERLQGSLVIPYRLFIQSLLPFASNELDVKMSLMLKMVKALQTTKGSNKAAV
ncbi:hypothetical protein E3N88_04680 [Mikania micrantha]|uniref:Uncharacterized protein n=1 Tax=Mikania micrantha TaxID=192012 RepID=A0A5N6PVL6_9ASTR|nr:hypothetical protein E3N88_04680 [Mikania micrantha]